jgi:hypothetical protein
MRPFFSYYGAKYTTAAYLGKPRRDLVIEPFAGSASYSTRWNARRVKLYDVSPDICELWDFLINCPPTDIANIPDSFDDFTDIEKLARGQQLLCRFWVAKGRAQPTLTLSPWYFKFRESGSCHVWGPHVKARIIRQKNLIAGWTIDQMSWENIPVCDAHWHVDPPYNNKPGSKYPFSKVDFAALGKWCKELPGAVDVCENLGADWLEFEHLCDIVSSRGRRSGAVSKEAVWRKPGWSTDPNEIQKIATAAAAAERNTGHG